MIGTGLFFPAEHGDSIMISVENESEYNILIDGGVTSTYRNYIKQEICRIINKGSRIDLVVCTHIDADHIGGLVQLLEAICLQ